MMTAEFRYTPGAWRPALAPRPGGGLLAAWEDERDGPGNVFFALGR